MEIVQLFIIMFVCTAGICLTAYLIDRRVLIAIAATFRSKFFRVSFAMGFLALLSVIMVEVLFGVWPTEITRLVAVFFGPVWFGFAVGLLIETGRLSKQDDEAS